MQVLLWFSTLLLLELVPFWVPLVKLLPVVCQKYYAKYRKHQIRKRPPFCHPVQQVVVWGPHILNLPWQLERHRKHIQRCLVVFNAVDGSIRCELNHRSDLKSLVFLLWKAIKVIRLDVSFDNIELNNNPFVHEGNQKVVVQFEPVLSVVC